tara:strand:+ start:435 stop:986 length:552 start_codon:yes stop_codon:yes gene_type:complete
MIVEAYIHEILDITLLGLLVITALAAVLSKNLLVSTVFLSIFSLLMAAEYLVMGAPDVAITEAAVGAGISTILLLLALLLVGENEKESSKLAFVSFIVVVGVAAALLFASLEMPEFGSADSPAQIYLSEYYLTRAPEATGIPNVVTSILASYRGYDTFGEVTVIFTAGMAVLLLLGVSNKRKK